MSAASASDSPATPAPTACPFCKSAQISTTDKASSHDAYWRCGGCGQIWNPSRLSQQRQTWRA